MSQRNKVQSSFAQKIDAAWTSRKFFSRKGAKAPSAAAVLSIFFASLRLCARNVSAEVTFLCKAVQSTKH
jgi:hypothetical protein